MLQVFATGQGVILLGALAAFMVLLWDWRASLAVLLVLQAGIAVLATTVEQVSAQTMLVQTLVMGLCCVMLASSGLQIRMGRGGRQSGGWFFRLLVLGLLAAALWSLDLSFVLPQIAPSIVRLLVWLGLIALLMLSLGDNPLFTSVALLLWCALGQVVAAVYTPVPEILVLVGLLQLALGLTCSYLVVAERLPRNGRRAVLSDLSFPDPVNQAEAPPSNPPLQSRLPEATDTAWTSAPARSSK